MNDWMFGPMCWVWLNWAHDQGAVVIVKSFNKERMNENLKIFEWRWSNKINGILLCRKEVELGDLGKGSQGPKIKAEEGNEVRLEKKEMRFWAEAVGVRVDPDQDEEKIGLDGDKDIISF
ncbi:hypothetical protein MLD38_031641 [Melastoma candidum]|uniref:Uncharacterized protein n=1 Tax=Melastoma candidum TaxID=119954 RepID=A0ACB9MV07_9MYRT|nr:hypothetical protein MLD38_031641 [Melastoma candidum]